MEETKLLYTKREAAAMLSISLGMLDALISHQRSQPTRIGRRVLLSRLALERFIARCVVA